MTPHRSKCKLPKLRALRYDEGVGLLAEKITAPALVSVSDKTGLIPFCRALIALGYDIIATRGSAKILEQAGIACRSVATVTGKEEILSGKLKTLHMQLYAAVLCDPTDPVQREEIAQLGIARIALVAINFYPVPRDPPDTEHLDIGGPALLRAAAKNHRHVIPLCDHHDYDTVITRLHRGTLCADYRTELAIKALRTTSHYDAQLSVALAKEETTTTPPLLSLPLKKQRDLRYGENPSQRAALYVAAGREPYACGALQQLQGAELSYNNLLDIDAGVQLVQEFTHNTATIIKHGNPCGVASGDDPRQTLVRARSGDARAAFGGVVVMNYAVVQEEVAEEIVAFFCECVVAPHFSDAALQVLARKKNLRVIPAPWLPSVRQDCELRSVTGAWLWQQTAGNDDNRAAWQVVTTTKVAREVYPDLHFAQRVVKRVKSNAVVLVKDKQLLAAGGGQTSRIDAVQLAIKKLRTARHTAQDLVLASDGFFPFADWVAAAKDCGVVAVLQPGGSRRDRESIVACDEHGIGMIFSGVRGFSH